MREILFKAKRLDNGEWVEKYLYIHNDKIVGQPTNSNTQNKRFGLRKIIAV